MCEWTNLIEIAKGLLTPVIAILTAYIAWQQWQENKLKLRVDRYDRRLKVYQEVSGFLGVIISKAAVSTDDIRQLRIGTAEADFLFNDDIPAYIDELVTHGARLYAAKSEYRDYTQPIPEGYDHKKVCDEMHAEIQWFSRQHDEAKGKFKSYLRIA